ncbi:DUF503 domain-containing protein [Pseudalkalibacillus berkeleyi]|uniref:DUF503 domain-containing protein n=1 Tax=Pseudalkalibacillus berkeleyi TaxID=1069813 RepID=A0ABS9GZX6_9BACL|nr:DUF503 domain-containing protein [Pseudalkalibacillus berkeleyi]MCF6137150.1 DUF503 domain-containing protein [Pseudalkalibacillus berkeleyi]
MIGSLKCECHIYDTHSLKEKRSVVKKVIQRLKQRFNVAVAETDHHDLWQRFEIGIVTISKDKQMVEKELQKVLESFDQYEEFQVTSYQMEIL